MLTLVRKQDGEAYANTQKANAQSGQKVAALPGGGFVVVWTDESQIGGDTSGSAVKAQLYDAAGAKVGGEFLVATFTSDDQNEPSVAALASGGFVVTWTHEEEDIALGGDGSFSSVKGQMFTAAGARSGSEFLVNSADFWLQGGAEVFALPNGGFGVAWEEGDSTEIYAQLFDSAGNRTGGEILASNGAAGIQIEPSAVAYGPDRFVVTWRQITFGPGGNTDAYGQIFDLAGNKIGDEFPVSTVTENSQLSPDVAALAGGGFVAVWQAEELTGNWAKAQIFDAAGAKVGPELIANSAGTYGRLVSVTALPWGGFLVAWENEGPVSGSYSERGQLFDGQGNKVGAEFLINSEPVATGGFVDVATLSSGKVVAVWTNESGGNAEQLGVKLQMLLPPTVGTPDSDSLSGTGGDDAISGLGGDDLIFGLGGNDLIEGDGGIDLLHGNDGDDDLSGGAGNDLLRGYAGVDDYDGGADDGLNTDGMAYGDRLSFLDARATQGVVADLRTGIVSNDGYGNVETMADIESLTGDTAFVDTYYGDDSSNGLWGGLGDSAYGFGGDDVFLVGSAPALVDGGLGTDLLQVSSTAIAYRPDSNGNGVAELAPPMTSGYSVDLAAGTIQDGYGNAGSVAGIENVTGSALGDDLRGSNVNNRIDGAAGNDTLWLITGGVDNALGGDGNDAFLFGKALTNGDRIDGGAGTDQLGIQGNYVGLGKITLGAIVNVEQLILLAGNDTRFGDAGTSLYSYDIRATNVNVAAGGLLQIDANRLRAGENFTFDGALELDGAFLVWAGKGIDVLTGGAGHDGFLFRGNGNWGTGDRVDGGAGTDQLGIRGDYDGANAIVMGANQIFNVEQLIIMSGTDTRFGPAIADADYDVTMDDGNVADGKQLTVDAASLRLGETFVFDGSAEMDGSFRIFGGQSADTIIGGAKADILRGGNGGDALTGGGGGDTFVYRNAGESTGTGHDSLSDLAAADRIDLPTAVSGWAAAVTSGALSNASFDSDLAAALDATLGPNQAILFTADDGDHAGMTFLVVDGNGDGAYTAGSDYVFALGPSPIVDTSSTALFV